MSDPFVLSLFCLLFAVKLFYCSQRMIPLLKTSVSFVPTLFCLLFLVKAPLFSKIDHIVLNASDFIVVNEWLYCFQWAILLFPPNDSIFYDPIFGDPIVLSEWLFSNPIVFNVSGPIILNESSCCSQRMIILFSTNDPIFCDPIVLEEWYFCSQREWSHCFNEPSYCLNNDPTQP